MGASATIGLSDKKGKSKGMQDTKPCKCGCQPAGILHFEPFFDFHGEPDEFQFVCLECGLAARGKTEEKAIKEWNWTVEHK